MCTLKGLHMYLAHHILSVLFPHYILGNNITAENHYRPKYIEGLWSIQPWKEYQQRNPATTPKAQGALWKKGWKCSKMKELWRTKGKVCFGNDSISELTREAAKFVIPYTRSALGQHWGTEVLLIADS